MPKRLTIDLMKGCHVAPDGEEICLEVADGEGAPVELVATPEQAASLLMTLPQLLTASLHNRYRDDTLRLVFPLQQYRVEASSDGVNVILSLRTVDGFSISFSMTPELSKPLGLILNTHDTGATQRPPVN